MFTGIVDHKGTIRRLSRTAEKITLSLDGTWNDLTPGESVAVDGVCLTVVNHSDAQTIFDLSHETIARSIAGSYEEGRLVNLERPLRPIDRFGGHFVTGHVDQTAQVLSRKEEGEFLHLEIGPVAEAFRRYLIPKGSVAINGVSLTINDVLSSGFRVCLIPHTLFRTNLAGLDVGEKVNLEFDWLVKVVCEQIGPREK